MIIMFSIKQTEKANHLRCCDCSIRIPRSRESLQLLPELLTLKVAKALRDNPALPIQIPFGNRLQDQDQAASMVLAFIAR